MTNYRIEGLQELLRSCQSDLDQNNIRSCQSDFDQNNIGSFKLMSVPQPRITSAWKGFRRRTVTPACTKGQLLWADSICSREVNVVDDSEDDFEKHYYELKMWADWMTESDRPNILLYGIGSKRKVMEAFRDVIK